MFKLLILLLAIQDQPAQGPLADAVEKRLQEMLSRSEERHAKVSQVYSARFDEMMRAMQEVRKERAELNIAMVDFKTEREGLIARLAEVRGVQNGIIGRLEHLQDGFKHIEERWTPLQNIVDRLTDLVWKVLWLCLLLIVVFVVVCSALLYVYVKTKALITRSVRDLV